MDYSYNYGFLKQFLAQHNLQKKDYLEALGSQDYVSLNKWIDGKVPMHITAMLRFCNYYSVPLSSFFFESGEECEISPCPPDEFSQTSPTDGYGIKNGRGRGIVETRITDRVMTSEAQKRAVSEGLRASRNSQAVQAQPGSQQQQQTGQCADAEMLRLKIDHAKEILQLEKAHREKEDEIRAKFDAEREQLMSIIDRMTKDIARLSATSQMQNYSSGDHNSFNMMPDADQH